MSSAFEEDDLGSQFESMFEDEEEDEEKHGGARLTRKKSGVQFKEKPGLKKKPSMRELRKRTAKPGKGGKGLAGLGDWKNELKKMNEELKGQKPMTREEKLKEEEKQQRIRVVSAKIHMVSGRDNSCAKRGFGRGSRAESWPSWQRMREGFGVFEQRGSEDILEDPPAVVGGKWEFCV